jgi:cyclopropane fatty-acyl-phospholipid synthase-like methyltransferase
MPADDACSSSLGGSMQGCWWLRPLFSPRDQIDRVHRRRPDLMLMPWQTFPSGTLYAGFAGIACVGAAGLHLALLRFPLKFMGGESHLAGLLARAAPMIKTHSSAASKLIAAIVHVAAIAVGTPVLAAAPCAAWFVSVVYRHCRARSLTFLPRPSAAVADCTRFLRFRDPLMQRRFSNRPIPIEDMYEMYFDGKLDIVGGSCMLKDVLSRRHEFVRYTFSLTRHLPFLLLRWIPNVLGHSKRSDCAQVRDHYDRGTVREPNPFSGEDDGEDDFFGMFLGRSMVYTAGVATHLDGSETLEQMQRNKLALVCSKLRMQPGDRHLDIGCGWGTLVQYAAAVHGALSTGVTLSRNQAHFAAARAKALGLDARSAGYLCMDYRDVPGPAQGAPLYDKISCLEMAEHVGVKNFQSFLCQVSTMLSDDGTFFLQIAGLRRPFQVGLPPVPRVLRLRACD